MVDVEARKKKKQGAGLLLLAALVAAVLLGSKKGSVTPSAPTVDVGPDQTVTLDNTGHAKATINYTVSDPAATLQWTASPSPGVTITPTTPAVADFTSVGTFTLTLTATLGALSGSDSLVVTVNPAATPAPVVDAGVDQTIDFATSGPDIGKATAIINFTVVSMTPVTLVWSLTSGPALVTITDVSSTQEKAVFTKPGIYVLRLTASNPTVAFDEVVITVNNPPAPVVNVGPDLTTTLNVLSQATAAIPITVQSILPFTLTWSVPFGPPGATVTFVESSPDVWIATFTVAGNYVLRLTANNGATGFDELAVTVKPAPPPSVTSFGAPTIAVNGSADTTIDVNSFPTFALKAGDTVVLKWRVANTTLSPVNTHLLWDVACPGADKIGGSTTVPIGGMPTVVILAWTYTALDLFFCSGGTFALIVSIIREDSNTAVDSFQGLLKVS